MGALDLTNTMARTRTTSAMGSEPQLSEYKKGQIVVIRAQRKSVCFIANMLKRSRSIVTFLPDRKDNFQTFGETIPDIQALKGSFTATSKKKRLSAQNV